MFLVKPLKVWVRVCVNVIRVCLKKSIALSEPP